MRGPYFFYFFKGGLMKNSLESRGLYKHLNKQKLNSQEKSKTDNLSHTLKKQIC